MTIDATRILDEIDKHTARARGGNPEKVRESLAAVRALCDLLLEDGTQAPKQRPLPLPVSEPASRPQAVPSAERLKEEGANGDSLFEF